MVRVRRQRVERLRRRRARSRRAGAVAQVAARSLPESGKICIFAFSDLRRQPVEAVCEWLERQPRRGCCERGCRVDLIVYAGDDIERFRPDAAGPDRTAGGPSQAMERATNFLERLAGYAHVGLVAVAGNDDPLEARRLISGRRVYELHTRPVAVGPFLVIGQEGGPRVGRPDVDIGRLLYGERQILRHLVNAARGWRGPVIVVSHAPPHGCLDGAVRFSTSGQSRPIGSAGLREFVERDPRVRLVLCGHVHRAGGITRRLGAATVVNVASHDDNPWEPIRAAVVELSEGGECGVHPVEIRLGGQVARVWQLGPKLEGRLSGIGIRNLEDLACADPVWLAEMVGWSETWKTSYWVAHARSLLTGTPVVLERPPLPPPPRLYVDIETDLKGSYCWLISIATEDGRVEQWMSDSGKLGERKVLLGFLEFLRQFPGVPLVWYGSQEKWVLPSRLKENGLQVPDAVERGIDVFRECFARLRIAVPVEQYGLKEVLRWIGFQPRHPDMFGWRAAYIYEEAVRQRAVGRKAADQLRLLREYGEDDVLGLRELVRWVEEDLVRAATGG